MLEDLNSSYYRDDATSAHLVPWELRVLAVRLQGMGYADARRGVMGYYDLAREARATLTTLKKNLNTLGEEDDTERSELTSEATTWTTRLNDLGVRVASALIEMEDVEGASRFLTTLTPNSQQLSYQKALLYLCLGDVEAARSCIGKDESDDEGAKGREVIEALAHIADADYGASAKIWEELIATSGEDYTAEMAMWRQNLAVCYLYLGRMDDVSSPDFHFSLSYSNSHHFLKGRLEVPR